MPSAIVMSLSCRFNIIYTLVLMDMGDCTTLLLASNISINTKHELPVILDIKFRRCCADRTSQPYAHRFSLTRNSLIVISLNWLRFIDGDRCE